MLCVIGFELVYSQWFIVDSIVTWLNAQNLGNYSTKIDGVISDLYPTLIH